MRLFPNIVLKHEGNMPFENDGLRWGVTGYAGGCGCGYGCGDGNGDGDGCGYPLSHQQKFPRIIAAVTATVTVAFITDPCIAKPPSEAPP